MPERQKAGAETVESKEDGRMRILRIRDHLRLRDDEIVTVRLNPANMIELPCCQNYGRADSNPEKVHLLRKAEILMPDGSWQPYPTITWIDIDSNGGKLYVTRAIIRFPNGENLLDIMQSYNEVPDAKLFLAAQAAGIYTEEFV